MVRSRTIGTSPCLYALTVIDRAEEVQFREPVRIQSRS
jgi:hypothetical protein